MVTMFYLTQLSLLGSLLGVVDLVHSLPLRIEVGFLLEFEEQTLPDCYHNEGHSLSHPWLSETHRAHEARCVTDFTGKDIRWCRGC